MGARCQCHFLWNSLRYHVSQGLADSINSLSCGIVSVGARVFFGFLGLFVYQWLLRYAAPVRGSACPERLSRQ